MLSIRCALAGLLLFASAGGGLAQSAGNSSAWLGKWKGEVGESDVVELSDFDGKLLITGEFRLWREGYMGIRQHKGFPSGGAELVFSKDGSKFQMRHSLWFVLCEKQGPDTMHCSTSHDWAGTAVYKRVSE